MKYIILSIIFLTSCVTPFGKPNKSTLRFHDSEQDKRAENLKLETLALDRKNFLIEKNRVWNEINSDAKESFKNIKELVENKCFACHDANTKLPIYGRIFRKINPVGQHQEDGLKALDFSRGFPFKAQGNPPQISILKSIKTAIIERTMPIKAFTFVYPRKKINGEDEKEILDWIDPVIEKLEAFDQKYNVQNEGVEVGALKILELKCFRCHANGNNKGSFGNMQNTKDLIASKYVNLEVPDRSSLYTHIISSKMPPSKLEALSFDEMNTVRDWLDLLSKKNQTK
ncbi:MAG: heme-binding domain-containing protein [Bacteriovorax sp.]|nr:heme-binding domain-containing protein [Bacteriovorax sp.]